MSGELSLKSLNLKWLVLLAVADVLAVLLFVAPEIVNPSSLTQTSVGRVLTTTVMPVAVLLIVNVLPSDLKAMLVYWKPRGALPGSEAFTKHGPADPRIDMATLKKNVGHLPTAPAQQNSRWYQLYKQVQNDPAVAEAHKLFLMYRDMAALSLPLVAIVPLALYLIGTAQTAPWLAAGLFSAQYLLNAFSARWSGIRFVCNVLAVHSVEKVAVSRAKPA